MKGLLSKKSLAVFGAYLLIAGLFPVFGSDYFLSVAIVMGLHAIVTIGLSLVMGYAGQISLGQAAFWGIGAYTTGILTTKWGMSPWFALIIAALIPAIAAFLMARAIAGLQGYYLAMATLAMGFIVQIIFGEWESVTGGMEGLIGIPSLPLFDDLGVDFYYLVWGMVTLVLLFSLGVIHSRIGRAFRAIHKSEIAATSIGINVANYKLLAFVLSGLFAGISGGLYASYMGIIDPQPFGLHESIKFLTMVVVGGAASVWGALLGTILIGSISEVLLILGQHFPMLKGDMDTIVYGAILVLCIIFMPEGLVPRLQKIMAKKQEQPLPAERKLGA